MDNNQLEQTSRKKNISLAATFYLIVLIWLIFGVQQLFHLNFARYGIIPRQTQGLWGIIFAPFIHASLQHIAYNTIPLFVLSLILALLKPRAGIIIWWILSITTGIGVWLFARGNSTHIGSSGVIFALIGFLLAYGIFRRSLVSILVTILVAAIYGGFLWGILPSKPWISWESHLSGVISGILWGIIWGRSDRRRALIRKLDEAT